MPIQFSGVHHMALTVNDAKKSKDFYMTYLGFQHLTDLGDKVLLVSGNLILGLIPMSDGKSGDRFSEHRVGLDHVSFGVGGRADLEAAAKLFDANKIPRGDINDLSAAGLPILVMSFRDPDNIQLELTAPA